MKVPCRKLAVDNPRREGTDGDAADPVAGGIWWPTIRALVSIGLNTGGIVPYLRGAGIGRVMVGRDEIKRELQRSRVSYKVVHVRHVS